MKKTLFAIVMLPTLLFAATPNLDSITQGDLDKVVEEFSANFLHTTLSPAHSLGDTWGFEVGLVAGVTETPELEAIVKRQSSSTVVDKIYHAAVIGAVTFPYAITGEISYLPKKTISDVSIKSHSIAAKWTITDMYFDWLPVDIAIKGHWASAELSYGQTVNNTSTGGNDVSATITLDSDIYGFDLEVGYDFFFLEPYALIGFVKADGEVGVSGSANISIFDTTFTSASSASSDETSLHTAVGLQFDLFLAHIAAEYSRAFGTNRMSGKVSFYF